MSETETISKRDVVMNYLCFAVGVLRAREGGDRPDQDIVADVPGMLTLCEQDAPDLVEAVRAIADDPATSQGVLKLLPDDDRAAVLADVAWNVVSWYLVDAVGELRGREGAVGATSDRTEIDLAAQAQALEKTLRDRKLIKAAEPWYAAVNLAQTAGATSEGVLEALDEDERADVLGKLAEVSAEPVEPTGAEDEQEPTVELAGEKNPCGAAWAKLVEVVGQGLPLEEADRHAREVAEASKVRRAELKKIIKDAEVELGRVEHAARGARTAYMNLANADRAREARLSKRTKLLVAAVDEAHRNGQRVSENVRRVVEAASKGLPITAEMVGLDSA